MLRVKDLRQARGLTREQLAVAAGISSRTIEYLEAGRDVKVSTIVAIAEVLNVSIGELFGERVA